MADSDLNAKRSLNLTPPLLSFRKLHSPLFQYVSFFVYQRDESLEQMEKKNLFDTENFRNFQLKFLGKWMESVPYRNHLGVQARRLTKSRVM